MNVRYFLITRTEVLVSSFTVLVVLGLVYKGISSLCDETYNPVFHGVIRQEKSRLVAR